MHYIRLASYLLILALSLPKGGRDNDLSRRVVLEDWRIPHVGF